MCDVNNSAQVAMLRYRSNKATSVHAVVSIQLNKVTCPTYPEKFIRDNVVARLMLQLCVLTVPQPALASYELHSETGFQYDGQSGVA